MNKEDFKSLFERELETAAKNAESSLGRSVPRKFEIELHGLPPHSPVLEERAALDLIYFDANRFYRVINVSVCKVSKDTTTIHMVVSGHPPSTFAETWNQPPGSGPFKQVFAKEIKVV